MTVRSLARALGALAAAGVLAGSAPAALAAYTWDVSLGGGAQVNDNLYLDPATADDPEQRLPVEETITTIAPAVMAEWAAGVDSLRLDYRGEYWQFRGDEDLESRWLHVLAADLSWRRWAPFFLEARELRGRTPRSTDREGEAVLDQIDWNQVALRTGLAWDFGPRGTGELAYRGEFESFPGEREADTVRRQYGEGLLRYRWNPLWETEFVLAYGQVDRDLSPDVAEVRAAAVVDQRWSQRVKLRYRLEWVRAVADEPAVDAAAPGEPGGTVSTDLLKALELLGDLEHGGSWNVMYADTQLDQANGDTLKIGRASTAVDLRARLGSTLGVGGWYENREYRISGLREQAWGPTLGVRWMIAPWVALDLTGSWTQTNGQQEGLEDQQERTTRGAAGLMVLLFKRVQLEAGYSYRSNEARNPLRSYDNAMFYGFVTYHFQTVAIGRLPLSRISLPLSPAGDAPDRLGL